MSIRYRPEIDGLRAIAVGAVLLYHLKINWNGFELLSGGFLGVDVFFVISGFLITSLIYKEWNQTGRFSVMAFYERRARRLLPALFIVIFASSIAASFLLLPSAMVDFSNAVLASIFFVSNIFWDFESQVYGARSGLLQPFLHTWSLAVEEQFYLTFPLIYVLVLHYAVRNAVWLGLVVAGFGLGLAEFFTARDFSFSFYWLFSRIWELTAGAVLAHVLSVNPEFGRSSSLARFMPGLGIVLIFMSLMGMKVQWHHPGIGTLPAILGSVLIVWFAGSHRDWGTRLLASRPMVGIGLISYSLYLWHYPIFAFGRTLNAEPGTLDFVVWLGLTFGLASLSYLIVERPFRSRSVVSLPRLVWLGLAATVVAVTFSIMMVTTDGMRSRFPALIALYGPNEFDNDILRDRSWSVLDGLAAAQDLGPSGPRGPSTFESNSSWFDPADAPHKVLLIGDSHSKDMFNAFYLNRDALPGYAFARFGMLATFPRDQRAALWSAPNFRDADTVALSFRYQERALQTLAVLLDELKAQGKQVIVFLNTTEFPTLGDQTLFDQYLRKHGELDTTALNHLAWQARNVDYTAPLNAKLREMATQHGVAVRDKEAFICNPETESCTTVTPDGRKVFYDYGHFTLEGAGYLGRRIVELNWLGSQAGNP